MIFTGSSSLRQIAILTLIQLGLTIMALLTPPGIWLDSLGVPYHIHASIYAVAAVPVIAYFYANRNIYMRSSRKSLTWLASCIIINICIGIWQN